MWPAAECLSFFYPDLACAYLMKNMFHTFRAFGLLPLKPFLLFPGRPQASVSAFSKHFLSLRLSARRYVKHPHYP